jgi:peroxiredoxin
MKISKWIYLICAAALILGGWKYLHAGDTGTAASWELKDVDGKTVKLSDFKGKVVILDFWATWCPPCRAEIPSFVELQDKYKDKGLQIIGISVDQDGAKVLKPFIEQNKINYPIILADEKVQSDYGGIEGIPTTFIIDKEGKISAKHVGLTQKAEFEKEIEPLLK